MLSTRRQIVHGFGALIGGVVTGCGHTAEPSAGGSAGAAGTLAGTGPGGTGAGGSTGTGAGGSTAISGMRNEVLGR